MADKIVQITATKNTASNVEYANKSVDVIVPNTAGSIQTPTSVVTTVTTPTLLVNSVQESTTPVEDIQFTSINTTVVTPKLTSIVVNMGEESLVNPGLFNRINDYYQGTDVISLGYGSLKFSQATTQDSIVTVMNFGRAFQQSVVTGDSFRVVDFSKVTPETVNASSIVRHFVGKVNLSAYSAADSTVVSYGKNLDNLILSSDFLTSNVDKVLTHPVNTTDTLTSTVNFSRSFESFVDATDDFLGEANLDDDQVASFGKNIVSWTASSDVNLVLVRSTKTELAQIADTPSMGVAHPELDLVNTFDPIRLSASIVSEDFASVVDDLPTLGVFKNVEIVVALTDPVVFSTSKNLLNTSTTQESVLLDYGKPIDTQAGISDTLSTLWQANSELSSFTQAVDTVAAVIGVGLVDQVNTLSTLSNGVFKVEASSFVAIDSIDNLANSNPSFNDFVDATDDFLGLANIDDDQVASFGKNLVNLVSSLDSTNIDVSSNLLDQTSLADPVSLTVGTSAFDIFNAQDQISLTAASVTVESVPTLDSYELFVSKNLTSSTTVADPIAISVSKPFLHTTIALDTVSTEVNYSREFTSSSTLVDNGTTFLVDKSLLNTAVASDTVDTLIGFNRDFTSSSSLTDSNISLLVTTQNFSNTVASDTVSTQANFSREFTSSSTLVDNGTTFLTNKNLVNTASTTDTALADLGKSLTTNFVSADTVSSTTTKSLTELVTSSDTFNYFIFTNRFIDEIAATNDSGFINNQSYFASSYAEPGYAGTNTNFS